MEKLWEVGAVDWVRGRKHLSGCFEKQFWISKWFPKCKLLFETYKQTDKTPQTTFQNDLWQKLSFVQAFENSSVQTTYDYFDFLNGRQSWLNLNLIWS